MRLRSAVFGTLLTGQLEAASTGCPDPSLWYRLRFDRALKFVGCSEKSDTKRYDNKSTCQVRCPAGMSATVDEIKCECTEINNHLVSCKWTPNRKTQTVKCFGKPEKSVLSASRISDSKLYFRDRP